MKIKFSIIAIVLYAITSLNAQEIKGSKFGDGLLNIVGQDSSWAMKVGLRMQFLGESVWNDNQKTETSFSIRRARLKFEGFAFSPKLEYKFQIGFSNTDIAGASVYTENAPKYIRDAVIKWHFHENFQLWLGQTKLPGNRERLVSSGDLQFVNRSLLNAQFTIDRDMGIQLHHHFKLGRNFVVKEVFALSQGEGRNVTTGNLGGYQYTTRVELLPFGEFTDGGDYSGSDLSREDSPKLALGATYDFNNHAVKTESNQGDYMVIDNGDSFFETNISTLFIDAMFKYNGFSLMGEYAFRDAKDPYVKNTDGTQLLIDGTPQTVQVGNALNLQAGYLFKTNWEVSGRFTNLDLDKKITGHNNENQYTLGVSRYIVGHKLKIQSDISYSDIANSNNQLMYRLQLDLHF